VPARELGVVVELIIRIPAQDDVAESKALLECREEFIARQVLAAHDAVGIEHADLDVLDAAFGQNPRGLSYLIVARFSHGTHDTGSRGARSRFPKTPRTALQSRTASFFYGDSMRTAPLPVIAPGTFFAV
jgi:hypothetical protein